MLIKPDIAADVQAIPGDLPEAAELIRVCHLSEYVHHSINQHPGLIGDLFAGDTLSNTLPENWYRITLYPLLDEDLEVDNLKKKLREFRRREMVRIIFRDFTRLSNLEETTRDLSLLAEACIHVALEYHYRQNIERYGEPKSEDGVGQQMCVLALGKLGGRELNLSSDIDLVFLYGEPGYTSGARQISNQVFFLRTARKFIDTLAEITVDGFVFRVDMRLRPFGESGALIQSWSVMEEYYLKHGRDWERYAFVKARAVAGDIGLGEKFLTWLSPFVYRRYLDFGTIESLRDMKSLIERQVESKSLHDDLKLGPGGIREVEFIAQAHQLVWGGTNDKLQERRLLTALQLMLEEHLLPAQNIALLKAAYVFLRNSEHAIQGKNDKQTQLLPKNEISRQLLAEVMGFADFDAYHQVLTQHRNNVRECFGRLVGSSAAEQELLLEGDIFWAEIWRDPCAEVSMDLLSQHGFQNSNVVARRLLEFSSTKLSRELEDVVQDRMDHLMPVLLSVVSHQSNPDETLNRVLPIIEAIERRSTYISFLLENPDALERTVELCAMSPWIAARLNEHPILLYELSDRNINKFSFKKEDFKAALDDQLMVLDPLDFESQMDTMRIFKNAAVLRVAVCELLDMLPLMKASDALTAIAEVILQKSLDIACQHLTSRHGSPSSKNVDQKGIQFAIVAYGKLGGIELAYGSDLDLVFLYDADIHGETDGEKPVNNNVFFVRLAHRIIHILTSFTRFGILYEADVRLRPSGNQGPIVSTFNAFESYQQNEAWTWEHQALIRSRVVAGDQNLNTRYQTIRNAILERQRDVTLLRKDVVDMRKQMRASLTSESKDSAVRQSLLSSFDLKHETGAIVDIEFMVQYVVLAWAHEHQVLSVWTDMMRLLDEIRDLELLSVAEVELLQNAYLAYRAVVHYQWLGGEMSSFDELHQYRQSVVLLWQQKLLI